MLLKKCSFDKKKLCVLKILFSYRKVSIRKQFFTGFDIKKSLAFGSTFFMSHPAKNRFPISTFPYLSTIWRTNSYFSILFIYLIVYFFQAFKNSFRRRRQIIQFFANRWFGLNQGTKYFCGQFSCGISTKLWYLLKFVYSLFVYLFHSGPENLKKSKQKNS